MIIDIFKFLSLVLNGGWSPINGVPAQTEK